MRVPLSWLRDFAPFDPATDQADVDALAAALSGLGLVVEGIERVGEGLEAVVVARVLETRVHPDADKVQLVDVHIGGGARGGGEKLQIVCGAFNFGAGDLVALAPIGAKLPNGMEISRRKVRGQWSEGMLCSASELKLGTDHDGIMVVAETDGIAPGMPLTDALGIGPDVVLDLDVTPNRPDAQSVAGVARDLAAHYRLPFAIPDSPALPAEGAMRATVAVTSPDLCPRFTAAVIEGVTVGPSPAWLANRLTRAGMRPINNVVDVSNYVMLELGQPNHPYDLDRLPGRGLSVRRGRPDETLVTLDDLTRPVGPGDCLICDAEGTAVGIGGIMGGASSEISPTTTTVMLEAAVFDPLAIARTSKRLGLRTEASVRFERGIDPAGVDRAVARYCQLVAEVAGGRVAGPLVDRSAGQPAPTRVRVRTGRVNAILGTELTPDEVSGYLEPIGFSAVEADSPGDFDVTIPTWRPDSEREIDVIEEVARHHGYSRIPRTRPAVKSVGALTAYQRDRRLVADILMGAGAAEAWATSFLAPSDLARAGLPVHAVEVENPLTAEESMLRTSLLPGLLRALVTNASHRRPDVRLFEIGHVFIPPPAGTGLPHEPEHLAVALGGQDASAAVRLWSLLVDGLRLDEVRLEGAGLPGLHPTRSARIVVGGDAVGAIGEIDPDVLAEHGLSAPVGWLEVILDRLLAGPRRPATYKPVSRFPSADIDLALIVDDIVPASDVEATLREAGGEELESVELFDVYRGGADSSGNQLPPGHRSLAYHLRFSSLDHTLTDEELAGLRRRCIEAVETAVGASLRG